MAALPIIEATNMVQVRGHPVYIMAHTHSSTYVHPVCIYDSISHITVFGRNCLPGKSIVTILAIKSQPPTHRKVVAKSLDFSGQIWYRENFPPKFLAMKCSDFTLDSGFVTFSNLIFFCLFRVQVYALSYYQTPVS